MNIAPLAKKDARGPDRIVLSRVIHLDATEHVPPLFRRHFDVRELDHLSAEIVFGR